MAIEGLTIFGLILLFLFLLITYFWYNYCYAPYQVLKRCGIPGPAPRALDGNAELIVQLGRAESQRYFAERHGSVCGYYIGSRPYVQITDLEMLREVFIKQFSNFTNREHFPALLRKNKQDRARGLLQARDGHWRRSRSILTPTFSAHKMKLMEPLIAESVKRLVQKIDKFSGSNQSFDVHKMFGKFTMEVILASAFGRWKDIQTATEDDDLTVAASSVFGFSKEGSRLNGMVLRRLLSTFPWLLHIIRFVSSKTTAAKGYAFLETTSMELIRERRAQAGTVQRKDLLQLMLETRKEDGTSSEGLTDNEIVAHSNIFLLAGYETTSNALSYCTYLLALNPDAQDRLAGEVEDYFKINADSSKYEASQKIEYLDWVFNETLRMYPPALRTSRETSQDVVIKGFTIPKGCIVELPIHYLHHNADHWPEPEHFDPERFSASVKEERDPLCFVPFGVGPRNCIGMRFAMLEAKMALMDIIRKYKILQAPDTEVPLQTVVGITMSPKNGVFVKFEHR